MMVRQTLQYLPAQLFGPMFQFLAAVIWTHQLDATSYGVVTFLIAGQELIALVVLGGWSAYILRFRAELGQRFGLDVRQRDLMFVLFASAVQMALAVPILMSINVPITASMASITALFLITRSALNHYADVCRAETAIITFTIGQLASPVLGCSLSFVAAYYIGSDPRAILGALCLAQTLGLIVVLRRLGVRGAPTPPDRELIRSVLGYSGPLVAGFAAMWIGGNGIRVVVEHMSGPIELGLFSVGWGLGQRIAAVVAMLVTAAAFPLAVRRLNQGNKADALQQVAANNLFMLGLLAPMAVGTAFISPNLVNLAIAEPFRAVTILIFPIATMTGALRNFAQHGAGQTYLLVSRTDLSLTVNIFDALTTMTCCAAGLYLGGVPGAAIGCLVAAVGLLVLTFTFAVKLGLPLLVGKALRLVLAACLMGGALAAVHWPSGLLGLIEAISFGGLVYAVSVCAVMEDARRMLAGSVRRLTSASAISES